MRNYGANPNQKGCLDIAITTGRVDRLKKLVAAGGKLAALSSPFEQASSAEIYFYLVEQLEPKSFCVHYERLIALAINNDRPDLFDKISFAAQKIIDVDQIFHQAVLKGSIKTVEALSTQTTPAKHPDLLSGLLHEISQRNRGMQEPERKYLRTLDYLLSQGFRVKGKYFGLLVKEISSKAYIEVIDNLYQYGMIEKNTLIYTEKLQNILCQINNLAREYGFAVTNNLLPKNIVLSPANEYTNKIHSFNELRNDKAIILQEALKKSLPFLDVRIQYVNDHDRYWVNVLVEIPPGFKESLRSAVDRELLEEGLESITADATDGEPERVEPEVVVLAF